MPVIARSGATRQSTDAMPNGRPRASAGGGAQTAQFWSASFAFGHLAMTGGRNDPASPAPARRS
jgi:hypothetical protein